MATLEEWYDDIHLIGVGGIGTHVLLTLIEMGAREVHIWDDDIVSSHNLPSQIIYAKDDIGRDKVVAARDFVERQGYDTRIIPHAERVVPDTELSGLVISGVDSMASRSDIWQAIDASEGLVSLYIDARIGGHFVHLFAFDPSDPTYSVPYAEKALLPDGAVADLSCITRENPHTAQTVSASVGVILHLFVQGEPFEASNYGDSRWGIKKQSASAGSTA